VRGEFLPTVVQVFSFGDHFLAGEVLDLEEVDLALEPGDLRLKLYSPVLDRLVPLPQGSRGDLLRQVEPEDLIRFRFEAVGFPPQGVEEIDLGLHLLVRLGEGARDLLRGEEESLELLLEDPLKVRLRHLVAACLADVLRGVRGDPHPAAAVAEGQPGEEMDGLAGGPGLPGRALLGEEGVRAVPEFLGDDRLDFRSHPLVGGLQDPLLALAQGTSVVRAAGALGGGVADQALHRRMAELAAAAGAVAALREEAGHGEHSSVLYI
jgi:hypothetical protein